MEDSFEKEGDGDSVVLVFLLGRWLAPLSCSRPSIVFLSCEVKCVVGVGIGVIVLRFVPTRRVLSISMLRLLSCLSCFSVGVLFFESLLDAARDVHELLLLSPRDTLDEMNCLTSRELVLGGFLASTFPVLFCGPAGADVCGSNAVAPVIFICMGNLFWRNWDEGGTV